MAAREKTRPHSDRRPLAATRGLSSLLGLALVLVVAALAASTLLPHGGRATTATARACAPAARTGLEAGQCAPGFTLVGLDDRSVSLSAYRGKPVLIHFWGIPCPTCQAEYPDFSRAVTTYAPKGLTVLAVDTWQDAPSQLQSWQSSHHLPITILPAGLLSVAPLYNITGTPTNVFIARSGRISAFSPGPLSYADYQKNIKAIL